MFVLFTKNLDEILEKEGVEPSRTFIRIRSKYFTLPMEIFPFDSFIVDNRGNSLRLIIYNNNRGSS